MGRIPEQVESGPYQLFMLGLCVYVLVALAIQTLVPISAETEAILLYVDTGICLIFLADFIANVVRVADRRQYVIGQWGWVDLVSSIPMVGPLRLGRVARLVRITRVLRGVRSAKRLSEHILARRAEGVFLAATWVSIIFLVFSSVAIVHVEADYNGANIKGAADALWWAFVTITTVGYGDRYPVSPEGRVIAAVLMTVGVGLFGTFTGFVASWFLTPGEEEQEGELAAIRRDLADLRRLLDPGRASEPPPG